MQSSLPQSGAIVAEKYVISRLLGRGGMGAVYVVEHRITGKKLALKCLLPEHLEHPEFVERFLREAQAAGRIQHRNVVDVFDVGKDGELIYIVMELLDGKPLSELLRAGQLSLEETLQILLRAMEGVAAAHAVGIVHRDLKPDNILVCVGQSGRLDDPRVLDFGISKLEDDVSKPLTKSGVMLGTPYYMAFEQINSQRDLDQRVDVYAMGVILYEAMAGQLPYVAESVGALAIRMMSGPPVPLSQLRPELPDGLAEVVMRSVARDRDQRYPTMQTLIEALRPYTSPDANLLAPKGPGTPLGSSLRSSRAIDATLPAMKSLSSISGGETSARLKLDGADHLSGRTPSLTGSSRTILWALGIGLLLIIGGSSLLILLGEPELTEAPSDPAAAPEETSPGARPTGTRPAQREPKQERSAKPAPAPEEVTSPSENEASPAPENEAARSAEDGVQDLSITPERSTRGRQRVVRGANRLGVQGAVPAAPPAAAPLPAASAPTPAPEAPAPAPATLEKPPEAPPPEAPPPPAAEAPPAAPTPDPAAAEPPPPATP